MSQFHLSFKCVTHLNDSPISFDFFNPFPSPHLPPQGPLLPTSQTDSVCDVGSSGPCGGRCISLTISKCGSCVLPVEQTATLPGQVRLIYALNAAALPSGSLQFGREVLDLVVRGMDGHVIYGIHLKYKFVIVLCHYLMLEMFSPLGRIFSCKTIHI